MSCFNSSKSRCMKSCARNYNNTSQLFLPESVNVLTVAGAKVVDTGIAIDTEPQSYATAYSGLYHIEADVTIAATTAGAVTLQWYMDGVALPCTYTEQYVAVAQVDTVHLETDLFFESCCGKVNHVFTLLLTADATAAGAVTHICSGVIKEH